MLVARILVLPGYRGSYVIDNAVNRDLVGRGSLRDVVSAIAIVLGGKGNWYIDKIRVNSRA